MRKIAVFASGNGSNFQAIVDSIKNKELHAEIALLVVNKKDAYAIERANKENIDTLVVQLKDYSSKEEYESLILKELQLLNIDLIVLAGYMMLIGSTLLNEFEGKIINIHPSLLPAFKGKNAIEQAIEYGVKVMGVTVHFVDFGMDTGKIIAQESFVLDGNEEIFEIESKVHQIEHRLYPKVIKELLEGAK